MCERWGGVVGGLRLPGPPSSLSNNTHNQRDRIVVTPPGLKSPADFIKDPGHDKHVCSQSAVD